MKRSWTALTVALAAVFAIAGCNDYGNTFQVNTGAVITFLSPSQIGAGNSDFTLTVIGSGFVAKTVVQWNGTKIPTTVTTDTNGSVLTVTATVAASLVAKPGTATVSTLNPASGAGNNGLSNTISFVINNPPNPTPTVSAVSPACAVAGSALPLTVTGTNFLNVPSSSDPTHTQFSTLNWTINSTQFQFTPSTSTPATITSTQITVTIPATDISTTGNALVTVSNPPSPPVPNVPGSSGSGGGTSNSTTVTIQSSPCPLAARSPANSEASSAIVAEETPAVSLDGRYVAYTAVQNEHAQVFMRDTCEGAPAGCQPRTTLLSVSADGNAANEESRTPSMSSDGRYVAFSSAATNLVENAPPGRQVFLRDTCAGAAESCKPSTLLVSADSNGTLVGTESILPSVSSSGRFVAFLAVTPSQSANKFAAQNKTPASTNNSGYRQVFIRDTCLGAANCTPKTTRISLQPGDDTEMGERPAGPALSGDSRRVAIPSGNAATLFTRSMAVDDRVFLAITREQH